MKKLVIVVSFIIVLIIIILLSLSLNKNNNSSKEKGLNKLDVTFYSNASTGYSWSYTISNEDIIDISSIYDDSACYGKVGCGGDLTYTIVGKKKGHVTLKFTYSFVDGSKETEEAIYEIDVLDDLSIKETHSGSFFVFF